MRHVKLEGLMTDFEKVARVAADASSTARAALTRRSGSIWVDNGDGTGTMIGELAGVDATGAPNGRLDFVGDTTPPGRPLGVEWSTAAGCITGVWGGSLEGGVPADFDRVEMRVATGGEMASIGAVKAAGSATSAELQAGTAYICTAVAVDVRGNESDPTEPVELVCASPWEQLERDAADALEKADATAEAATKGVQEAKDAAKAAGEKADAAASKAEEMAGSITEVTTTVNGVKQDVDELSSKVEGAVTDAGSALTAATEAKQTATEISSKAETALKTADAAQKSASEAKQTADGLTAKVDQATETADSALTRASEAKQTATELSATIREDYVSKTDATKTYATKTELTATSTSLTSKITETAQTAKAAQDKATQVEQTASGLSATVTEVSKTASSASSKADAASTAAGKAQTTANAASTAAGKAQSTADSAVTKATTAQATADGLKTSVTKAQTTADSAVKAASTAQQTATSLKTTVQTDYLKKADAASTYASKSSVTQTADSIKAEVSKTYATQSTVNGVKSAADRAHSLAANAKPKKVHYTTGTSGQAGFFLLAVIKVTANHSNACHRLSVSNRLQQQTVIEVTMGSVANLDPSLGSLKKSGPAEVYMAKAAASTWNLYVKKSESYDALTVTSFEQPSYGPLTFTWGKTQVASLPSGYVTATPLIGSSPAASYMTKTEVQQTASDLTVKITTAQTTANTAKSTADSAKSAASTAQSTANTAKSAASTAQSTANTANSKASTLETLIRASGQGVEVARKVNGSYTDARTLMSSDSFQVLDKAGAVLAKFAANLVELGRNSASSVIKMCGGVGEIIANKASGSASYNAIRLQCRDADAAQLGYVEVSPSMTTLSNQNSMNQLSTISLYEGYMRFISNRFAFQARNSAKGVSLEGDKLVERIGREIRTGSVVKDANGGDSVVVFSAAEVKAMNFSPNNGDICVFMNGDEVANNPHIEGSTYLNGAIYALFNRKVTGKIRINYLIVFNGVRSN